jgi:hypothetical protein
MVVNVRVKMVYFNSKNYLIIIFIKFKLGFYDSGSVDCQPCHYSCATCVGPNDNNCLTCSSTSNRAVISYTCPCKDGTINFLQINFLNLFK